MKNQKDWVRGRDQAFVPNKTKNLLFKASKEGVWGEAAEVDRLRNRV